MATQRSSEGREFGAALVSAGMLVPLGLDGLYARSGAFERIVVGIDALVGRTRVGRAGELLHFPPVFARATLHRSGYLERFPHLCGSVHGFEGDDAANAKLQARVDAGEPYGDLLADTDVALVPAACLPLYPTLTGTVPAAGRDFDLCTFVFRREPSEDPARMQCFRQREKVRVGSRTDAVAWRDEWKERGLHLLRELGLDAQLVDANDPFFGRGGRFRKADQREQRHKFEVVVPIASAAQPTAVASFNYHEDTFGRGFAIALPDGSPAHTACLGFGLERVTLALLRTHGLDPAEWPAPVRRQLWS